VDGLSLSPVNRLGPYEIQTKVGAGGMGEVYRARDTRLGRTVAVKVLPPELSANAERKHRFEREARAISQLSHPHVCALFDVGQQDGIDYLVMEADRRLMVVELEVRNGSLKASAPRLVFQTRITAAHTALFQYTVAPDGPF
jgi:serine/threonine protein kinase